MEKSTSYDQEIQQKLASTASSVTNGNQNGAEIHQLDQAEAKTLSSGINGNQHRDQLVISIKEMVESSLELPVSSYECCIYRIPTWLRKLNEEAYTPQVISIGPFHHGSKRLKTMEKFKLKCFKRFLHERIEVNVEILVNNIKHHEERVRDCYAESSELSSNDFVKLILVDGSFVIEFFYEVFLILRSNLEDCFLQLNPISHLGIIMDLQLLENQLPFFILEILFRHAHLPICEHPSFTSLAIDIFERININQELHQNHEAYESKHFVDLARAFFLPSSRELPPHGSNPASADQLDTASPLYEARVKFQASSCKCLLDLPRHLAGLSKAFFVPSSKNLPLYGRNPARADHLYTASQLDEVGVKFKVNSSKCLLDLKFANGTFEIPCMNLNNSTETTYRNVIAFEQCHYYTNNLQFTNYIVLLTFLITTPKDVDLLIRKGIIINGLGSSKAVASFLNNLGTNVPYSGIDSTYRDLFEELNSFYENPKHIWKATLKRDYFSTPWRIASTVTAGILLLLTLGQFICSIIQVVKM